MDQKGTVLTAPQHAERSGIFLAAAGACFRMQARLLRLAKPQAAAALVESTQRAAGAMFSECLTNEEKSRLTVEIYDGLPSYPEGGDRLEDWEEAWFARRMPAPPARLLIGACGTGREAVALVSRGYRVTAFEPAPRFVAASQRRLGARATVMQLTYEELSARIIDDDVRDGESRPLRDERFDCVLLGCGSLSHILEAGERRRLFQALDVVCPTGPILISFSSAVHPASAPMRMGRAVRVGRSVGRVIAGLRDIDDSAFDRLNYSPQFGFAYSFTARAIEHLAADAGRVLAWERSDGAQRDYATLLVRGKPEPSG